MSSFKKQMQAFHETTEQAQAPVRGALALVGQKMDETLERLRRREEEMRKRRQLKVAR